MDLTNYGETQTSYNYVTYFELNFYGITRMFCLYSW
jgi:hypothetical protein